MDLGLQGKVAIITGGSDGIGLAAAISMAGEGARVAILARDQGRLDSAAEEIKAAGSGEVLTLSADVRDREAVQAAVHDRGVPVLRKEFIFDPYQVYEARAHGADAILLIVAMLSPSQLAELGDLAGRFWMQTLVEVHDEAEMKIALDSGADIVGINNRDLRTFVTDLAVTDRLAGMVPSGKIVVSESGVSSRDQVDRVGRAGAHAVLVGEALVAAVDVAAKLNELI